MLIKAGFGWLADTRHAIVEMASASGIELLSQDQLNPMKTTTFGTGQLIKAAADYGAEKILLAVGSSATVDGGIGAAKALGWDFLNKDGNPVEKNGKGLTEITQIVKPENLSLPAIEILCDVTNPLCGEKGAATVFGPQKGATPEMVIDLDRGLENLAMLVKQDFGIEIEDLPGAGAAGGISAAVVAFMNGKLVSGVDTIIAETKLEEELQNADWLITGEGSFDTQSLDGKVVSGLAKLAGKYNVKVAVIAGKISISDDQFKESGIEIAISCSKPNMTVDYAIANSKELLTAAVDEFYKLQV
jgi:glycerate kinase